MRPRLCLLALVLHAAVLASCSPAAFAAPALSPPVPGVTLLAFGVTYGSASRVHHGLDLAAAAGARVLAAAGGSVTFAGRLPSESGNDVLAVTITTADGAKVTCMPLERLDVAKGASVASGDVIGTVASGGDPSSEEAHVHLSVRVGEAYLDPAKLLPAVVPSASQPQPEPAPATSDSPATSAHPAPAASAPPASAPLSAAHAPSPAGPTDAAAELPELLSEAGEGVHASTGADNGAAALTTPRAAGAAGVSAASAASHAAASAALALSRVSDAPALKHASPPAGSALFARAGAMAERFVAFETGLAALLVAAALLWPAWRKASQPIVSMNAEAVPVRAES